MLLAQHSHEKSAVSNGDQLVHSIYLRSLVNIAIGLNLIDILCLELDPVSDSMLSDEGMTTPHHYPQTNTSCLWNCLVT